MTTHGEGRLDTVQGIHVVQLRGSWEAMGRQHAALANAVCGDVVPQYLDRLIEKLVAHAVPPLAAPAGALLKRLFHFRNAGRMGGDVRALLAGLSAGFDADPRIAERVLFVPDILHWLAGKSFVPLAMPPMCSGLWAAGAATAGGRQLFARNFDFFGRGVWNACNALIVMRPDDGQRVCWIGALGAPCGPQGFNESGLAVSLHTNFTRDVRTRGIPLFTLCHRIMTQCTSLEEAIRCIESEPRLCGLSLFVVDAKARAAAVAGFSARAIEVVQPEGDVLVRTNHYATPPMQRIEIAPHAWQRNSRGRFRRIHDRLEALRGRLEAAHLPAILSDCFDVWEERARVTGNIVACVNTTQSLVISADDDTLWLAHGDHPVSHAAQYAGFRMSALLDGEPARYACDALPGGPALGAAQRAALHEYAEAWSEYFDRLDHARAVFHLRRAAALLPEEPIFPRMAGILLLKQRRYALALPLLLENAAHDYRDALMRGEALVWAGRCLDLMGRRSEAAVHYRAAAALGAAPVSGAAARHIEKPFRPIDLIDVAPEFICGTAIARYRQL